MKRALILGLGALLIATAVASAQGKPPAAPKTSGQATVCANFVDANGDGICDNFQNGTRGANGQGPGKVLRPRQGQRHTRRDRKTARASALRPAPALVLASATGPDPRAGGVVPAGNETAAGTGGDGSYRGLLPRRQLAVIRNSIRSAGS